VRESASRRGFGNGSWLALAAAVAILGFWSLSRANAERAESDGAGREAETPIAHGEPAAQAELGPRAAPDMGEATKLATEPPAAKLDTAPSQAAPSAALEQAPPASPSTALEPGPSPSVASPEEPIRLTAYKAVALASGNAARCRYRGDGPGDIRVIVTFQPSGTVERTTLREVTSNPMTARCISSQFSGLTVPAFSGEPMHVATSIKLR
jgi:hypothetical protein